MFFLCSDGSRSNHDGEKFKFSGRDLSAPFLTSFDAFFAKGSRVSFQLYKKLMPRQQEPKLYATRLNICRLTESRYLGVIDRIPVSKTIVNERRHEPRFGWIKVRSFFYFAVVKKLNFFVKKKLHFLDVVRKFLLFFAEAR